MIMQEIKLPDFLNIKDVYRLMLTLGKVLQYPHPMYTNDCKSFIHDQLSDGEMAVNYIFLSVLLFSCFCSNMCTSVLLIL